LATVQKELGAGALPADDRNKTSSDIALNIVETSERGFRTYQQRRAQKITYRLVFMIWTGRSNLTKGTLTIIGAKPPEKEKQALIPLHDAPYGPKDGKRPYCLHWR